jgi:hypothetical protein
MNVSLPVVAAPQVQVQAQPQPQYSSRQEKDGPAVTVQSTTDTMKHTTATDFDSSRRTSTILTGLYFVGINTYASLLIFTRHLICYESIISIVMSVGLTIYLYYETQHDDTFHGNTMSWVLLTFAVITPIGSSITMAYKRRENALQCISTLRSTFIQLYTSYSIWGWDYQPATCSETTINGRTKVT